MVDFHDSSGVEYAQILRYVGDVPEFAKAYVDRAGESSKLAGDDDGYPMDSPEATWWSAAYLALRKTAGTFEPRYRGHLTYLESRVADAARIWQVDVAGLPAKLAAGLVSDVTPAYSDDEYGLVVSDGDVTKRAFPLIDATCVKLASGLFEDVRSGLPAAQRRTLAAAIVAKAAQFGVRPDELPDSVHRSAGEGVTTAEKLAASLRERATNGAPEFASDLASVAEQVLAMTPEKLASSSDELVEAVTLWDKTAGYASMTLPEDLVYAIPVHAAEKLASAAVNVGGVAMLVDKLAGLPASTYGRALGSDFVGTIVGSSGRIDRDKLATALMALPEADSADLLAELRRSLTA